MTVDRPRLLCSSHEGSHFSLWKEGGAHAGAGQEGGNKGECQGGASLRSERKSFLNSIENDGERRIIFDEKRGNFAWSDFSGNTFDIKLIGAGSYKSPRHQLLDIACHAFFPFVVRSGLRSIGRKPIFWLARHRLCD